MVARVGSIEVLFSVSYDKYERGMRRAAGLTEREGGRMSKAVGRTDTSVRGLKRSMAGLRGREFRVLSLAALRAQKSVDRLRGSLVAASALFGGFGAAFTIKGLADYSDTYKEIGNRIQIVKRESQSLASIQEEIFLVAQKSRSQYDATGILFTRLANSARRLKLEQKDILRVTETIQKSFIVGGSTPTEAVQSSIQLSQGIASNRLQGDELRSVLENPALGQLLANKITDGDLGKLREIAAEGKLTASVMIAAFKDASAEIDALFDKTQETIGQAFIKLDNAVLKYVGTSDKMNASASATVVAINAIAENIDTVADSLVILAGAFASIAGGRGIGGFTSGLIKTGQAAVFARKETALLAKAELALANKQVIATRSSMMQSRLKLNRAINEGVLSTKQMSVVQKKTSASIVAHRTATQAATAAQIQYNAAAKATSVRSIAAAAGVRTLSTSLSFLGGPVGVALLTLGAAFFFMQKKAQAAQERADRYADSIKQVGLESLKASDRVKIMAGELDSFAKLQTFTIAANDVRRAKEDLNAYYQELRNVITGTIDWKFAATAGGIAAVQVIKPLTDLLDEFKKGNIDVRQFNKSLDEIGKASPGLRDKIEKMQKLAVNVEAVNRTLADLLLKLDDIDGYEAIATVKVETSIFGRMTDVQREQMKSSLDKNAEDFVKENEKAIVKKFKKGKLSPLLQRMYGDILEGVEKDKARKGSKKIDRLDRALARLNYQIESIDFSQLDQDTIQFARSAGVAEAKIREFIAAIKSGGEVPAVLEGIRAKLQEFADVRFGENLKDLQESGVVLFLSDLDRETVKAARSFGLAEEQITAFIKAASSGNIDQIPEKFRLIRSELEKIAQNKELVNFAGDVADVFGDVANALFDGGNAEDIFKSAAKSIAKLIFQLLVVEPMVKSIRDGLSGGLSGGGIFGTIAKGLLGGFKIHDGTVTGTPKPIVAPASMFSNAPRLHDGLKTGEFAAVLEKTESVLTSKDTNRTVTALQSATQAMAAGGQRQVVDIRLTTDSGLIADIASQQVKLATGQIVNISVERSRRAMRQDLPAAIVDVNERVF